MQSLLKRDSHHRESVIRRCDVSVQGIECLGGECRDLGGGAEAGPHLGQLTGDLGRLDSGLGVLGARLAFLSGGAVPFAVQAGAPFQSYALEGELLAGRVAQQQSFEDGLYDVIAAVGYRYGDAERLADLDVLAQQDVQHDPVDAVVGAVQRHRPDGAKALPEPVDPALALLVPGRVPGQVGVDYGLEAALQVDAFRQAVGGNEHRAAGVIVGQVLDPLLALVRRQDAGDRGHRVVGAQMSRQVLCHILGRVDETAEHNRVVALKEQFGDDLGEQGELGVVGAFQPGRPVGESSEPPAVRGFSLRMLAVGARGEEASARSRASADQYLTRCRSWPPSGSRTASRAYWSTSANSSLYAWDS